MEAQHINSTFLDQQKVDFAYSIFWTKITQQWTPTYRQAVLADLNALFASDDFLATTFQRVHPLPILASVPSLRSQHYAGASLLALAKVLTTRQHMEEDTPSA